MRARMFTWVGEKTVNARTFGHQGAASGKNPEGNLMLAAKMASPPATSALCAEQSKSTGPAAYPRIFEGVNGT